MRRANAQVCAALGVPYVGAVRLISEVGLCFAGARHVDSSIGLLSGLLR
jgi:hypothetical protein